MNKIMEVKKQNNNKSKWKRKIDKLVYSLTEEAREINTTNWERAIDNLIYLLYDNAV